MRWMLLVTTFVTLGVATLAESRATVRNMARTTPAEMASATPAPPAPRTAPAWKNQSWLNSAAPLTLAGLKGHVVLLNFWVFTCYNCTNTVPSLVAYDKQYRERGLTIIGIHTPEFPPYAGEHDKGNVAKALAKYDIQYPIAQDNDRATWDLYHIQYWPSFVLIDKQGRIRYEGYGEFHVGDEWHKEWAKRIETLLAE